MNEAHWANRANWGANWAIELGPADNESVSGDAAVVLAGEDNVKVAVFDGLGHGPLAQEASALAVEVFQAHPSDSLVGTMAYIDRTLKPTRGAVGTAAWIHGPSHSLQWAGVGNVEGLLVRSNQLGDRLTLEAVISQTGVLGQGPKIQSRQLDWLPGDTLLLVTDGIERNFVEALRPNLEPKQLARHLISAYKRPNDDAAVVVLRLVDA